MGKKKKYLLKSINFGEEGHLSRSLVESYVAKHGKTALSDLMRKLTIFYLSDDKAYDKWKKESLIIERNNLKKEMFETQSKIKLNAEKLEKLGVEDFF